MQFPTLSGIQRLTFFQRPGFLRLSRDFRARGMWGGMRGDAVRLFPK